MLAAVFGPMIRRLRVSRGMTQADLVEASGVSQPNVSAIETGRRMPSAETFERLVRCCGYELAAVAGDDVVPLGHDPTVAPAEAPPSMTMDERRRALVAVLELSDAIVRSR